MVHFECPRCNFETDHRSNMKSHIDRKTKCTVIKNDIDLKEFENEILDRTFEKIYLLSKIKKLELEVETLKKQLAEKPTKITTQNNTNNNIGRDQNINTYITIQLRPYNDPKLSDDMDDIYEDAWSKQKSVPTFIERLHLNGDLPENHNMCITNLRTKLAKVFTEQGWVTKDQDQILDEIIKNSNRLLDNWVKAKKRRETYKNDFMSYLEDNNLTSAKVNDDAKKELKLILYDAYKNGMVDIRSGTKQHTQIEDEFS
jgi:hypothetical protein